MAVPLRAGGARHRLDRLPLRPPRRRSTTTARRSPGSSPTSRRRRSSARASTRSSSESRRALERILQVAPRFLAEDSEDVAASSVARRGRRSAPTTACSGGSATRASSSSRSIRRGLMLDRVARSASTTSLGCGRGRRACGRRSCPTSSSDATATVSSSSASSASARRCVRRSSSPGRASSCSSMSWQTVVSEPDPTTLAIVRRFADQAGLALEQLERRRAEERGRPRARTRRDGSRRSPRRSRRRRPCVDVGNTCLSTRSRPSARRPASSCSQGRMAPVGPDRSRARATTTTRWTPGERRDLDADVPFARAIANGRARLGADGGRDVGVHGAARAPATHGWVTVPLETTPRRSRGAAPLAPRPRELSDGEREWLQSMVSQCGQALERSALYEEEQRLAPAVRAASGHDGAALERFDVERCGATSSSTRSQGRSTRRRSLLRPPRTATCRRSSPRAGDGADIAAVGARAPAEVLCAEELRALSTRASVLLDGDRRLRARRTSSSCRHGPGPRRSCSCRSSAGRQSTACCWPPGTAPSRSRRRSALRPGARRPGGAGARPSPRTSSPSSRSPRRCSAASYPSRSPASKACRSRRATCPAACTSTSAVTGSMRSSCATASSVSSWATSSARGCTPPRAWRSCGTRSARSPSSD